MRHLRKTPTGVLVTPNDGFSIMNSLGGTSGMFSMRSEGLMMVGYDPVCVNINAMALLS